MHLQCVELDIGVPMGETLYQCDDSVFRSATAVIQQMMQTRPPRSRPGSPVLSAVVHRLPRIHHELPVLGRKVLIGRLGCGAM